MKLEWCCWTAVWWTRWYIVRASVIQDIWVETAAVIEHNCWKKSQENETNSLLLLPLQSIFCSASCVHRSEWERVTENTESQDPDVILAMASFKCATRTKGDVHWIKATTSTSIRQRKEEEQQIIVGWWEFRWLMMSTIVTLQYYYMCFFCWTSLLHHYYGKYYTRMSGQELGDGIQWRGSIRRRLGRTSMDFGSVFKGQLKNILMIRRYPNGSQTWTRTEKN